MLLCHRFRWLPYRAFGGAKVFNAKQIADGKGHASLSALFAEVARKRSICAEIVSAETRAKCEFTAELEYLEALLLIYGES